MYILKTASIALVTLVAFSGCSNHTPNVFKNSLVQYQNGFSPEKSKSLFNEILQRSKYGLYTGLNDFGVRGHVLNKHFYSIEYVNSVITERGQKLFNIVEFKIPYKIVRTEYINKVQFGTKIHMSILKNEIDSLDNLSNIRRDLHQMINTSKTKYVYSDKINFDPKKVIFGTASYVQNGKISSNALVYNGLYSVGCDYEYGCKTLNSNKHYVKIFKGNKHIYRTEKTYSFAPSGNIFYQSIDVITPKHKHFHVVQAITDDRYDFIHMGNKIYLFQMEDGKWIVKNRK